jgi:hypothetical protein
VDSRLVRARDVGSIFTGGVIARPEEGSLLSTYFSTVLPI